MAALTVTATLAQMEKESRSAALKPPPHVNKVENFEQFVPFFGVTMETTSTIAKSVSSTSGASEMMTTGGASVAALFALAMAM